MARLARPLLLPKCAGGSRGRKAAVTRKQAYLILASGLRAAHPALNGGPLGRIGASQLTTPFQF